MRLASFAWTLSCAALAFPVAAAPPPWGHPYPPPPRPPLERLEGPAAMGATLSVFRLPASRDAYRIDIRTDEPARWRVRVYPERGRVIIEAVQRSRTFGPYGSGGGSSRMRQSVSVPRDGLPFELSVSETNEGWEVSIPRRTRP